MSFLAASCCVLILVVAALIFVLAHQQDKLDVYRKALKDLNSRLLARENEVAALRTGINTHKAQMGAINFSKNDEALYYLVKK